MRNFIFLKIMTMYFALLMVIICSYHQKANEYITICIRHIVLKNKVNHNIDIIKFSVFNTYE